MSKVFSDSIKYDNAVSIMEFSGGNEFKKIPTFVNEYASSEEKQFK